MAEFNLCQQAFVLSIKTNALATLNDNAPDTKSALEKRLLTYLDDYLGKYQAELGDWAVVWGPAVYSDPDPRYNPTPGIGMPDGAVCVVRKAVEPPVYVVAVAATNVGSKFGWRVEDGAVDSTVAWKNAFTHDHAGKPLLAPYGNPTDRPNPTLSYGTVTGVQVLLSTVPEPDTLPSDPAPVRLHEFLADAATGKGTLIVVGHSLGGALAPALAMVLVNPNGGPLARDGWSDVFVLPTAGATPGNADFASAFAELFAAVPHKPAQTHAPMPDPSVEVVWNQDIRNAIDIVPRAWVPADLDGIPPPLLHKGGIYPQLSWAPSTKEKLRHLIDAAKRQSEKGAATQPSGAPSEAGPYTALPGLRYACPEIGDPEALIVSIAKQPDPDPDAPPGQTRESFLMHWRPHHYVSYVRDIFHVDAIFDDLHTQNPVEGAFMSLLGAEVID